MNNENPESKKFPSEQEIEKMSKELADEFMQIFREEGFFDSESDFETFKRFIKDEGEKILLKRKKRIN